MKAGKRIFALLLTAVIALSAACPASAKTLSAAEQMDISFSKQVSCRPGEFLAQSDWIPAGISVSDWLAFTLAVSGVKEAYGVYLKELERYVTEKYAAEGSLSSVMATEYHRIALTVLALGGDPRSFGRDADGHPVDLIADSTWGFAPGVDKQGINGVIYALIALDARGYATPEGSGFDRELLLETLAERQAENGGFGLIPGSEDVDITAMALTALAPYRDRYPETVERAIGFLASQLSDNGTYVSFRAENAESVSQVIIALCTLGIDPAEDGRFIRNGRTLLDTLDGFRLESGTYSHVLGDTCDPMATEQAVLALTALDRLRTGGDPIYDFTNYTLVTGNSGGMSSGRIALIAGAAVVAAAVVIAFIIVGKRRKADADTDK